MPEENVQQYHRGIATFEDRNLDAFLLLFDPDAEFSPRSAAMEGP